MPSDCLILCHPIFSLPSIFPSIRVFSIESALCIRWPKCWSFSFSISLSNMYSELISFRIDWFDLLAVQETLKSLLQHHNSKASILWCSAFFMVQVSHWETQTVFMTQVTWMWLWFTLLSLMLEAFFQKSDVLWLSVLTSKRCMHLCGHCMCVPHTQTHTGALVTWAVLLTSVFIRRFLAWKQCLVGGPPNVYICMSFLYRSSFCPEKTFSFLFES